MIPYIDDLTHERSLHEGGALEKFLCMHAGVDMRVGERVVSYYHVQYF